MTLNRYMAFGMLAVALTVGWFFFHKFPSARQSDASGMVVISGVASIIFSAYLILSWKRKWVWVRSSRIIRSADPFSYWIAMLGFGLVALVFLLMFAWSCYVLSKPSA